MTIQTRLICATAILITCGPQAHAAEICAALFGEQKITRLEDLTVYRGYQLNQSSSPLVTYATGTLSGRADAAITQDGHIFRVTRSEDGTLNSRPLGRLDMDPRRIYGGMTPLGLTRQHLAYSSDWVADLRTGERFLISPSLHQRYNEFVSAVKSIAPLRTEIGPLVVTLSQGQVSVLQSAGATIYDRNLGISYRALHPIPGAIGGRFEGVDRVEWSDDGRTLLLIGPYSGVELVTREAVVDQRKLPQKRAIAPAPPIEVLLRTIHAVAMRGDDLIVATTGSYSIYKWDRKTNALKLERSVDLPRHRVDENFNDRTISQVLDQRIVNHGRELYNVRHIVSPRGPTVGLHIEVIDISSGLVVRKISIDQILYAHELTVFDVQSDGSVVLGFRNGFFTIVKPS